MQERRVLGLPTAKCLKPMGPVFQERAAEPTARHFRVSYTLFRIVAFDLWTTLGGLIAGLVLVVFFPSVGRIILAVCAPLFLAETVFTVWFANRAAENLGYTLGRDELIVESDVFIRRKAKIPLKRIRK